MDALLFKSNLRETHFCKDEYKKVKRAENNLRCKQARGTSVKEKRKIPEHLEYSNDSIHVNKKEEEPKRKKVTTKFNKPSRVDLLREWRNKKEAEKKVMEKARKAPFVVKHIVHKDIPTSDENKREIIRNMKLNTSDNNNRRVLKERNSNIKNSILNSEKSILKPELNKATTQRQSYTEWKKSQDTNLTKPNSKTKSAATKKNDKTKVNKDVKECPRRHPATRSGKNTVSSENQKNELKRLEKNNTEKTQQNEEPVKTKNIQQDINTENIEFYEDTEKGLSNCDSRPKNISVNVGTGCDPEKNDVLESSNGVRENVEDEQQILPVEALVKEPVAFEPPSGLAFLDFKINQKVVLDAMTDFFPATRKPEESELFVANLSKIPRDSFQENLTREQISENSSSVENEYCQNNKATKTPVLAFKEREGIQKKTPTSTPKRLSMSASKRTSLTPNPKNFLHKMEDPIAQKMEAPKSRRKLIPADTVSESVGHFTALVAAEESKFKVSLQKWEKIQEENIAPEEIQGNILAAIGQAQLFMRKRFKQFKDLIELHKDTSAEKAAHASDLDGFWEMIYYQVEDVHKRFEELDKLKKNGWVDDTLPQPVEKKVAKKTKPKKTKSKPVVTSTKRNDFLKFKQQMLAKKQAQQEKAVIPENEAFIQIITPLKKKDGEKIMTPVRRSIRNLPDNPQKSSNLCLIFPIENKQQPMSVGKKEKAKPEETNEEKEIDKKTSESEVLAQVEAKTAEDEFAKSLRRSTRKTPSKYKSSNFFQDEKKPEHIACNLFDKQKTPAPTNEGEVDFSRYLSMTVSEDQPVKRDLLTSFDTPVSKDAPQVGFKDTGDLMVFASPIYLSNKENADPASSTAEASIDLLL